MLHPFICSLQLEEISATIANKIKIGLQNVFMIHLRSYEAIETCVVTVVRDVSTYELFMVFKSFLYYRCMTTKLLEFDWLRGMCNVRSCGISLIICWKYFV